MALISSNDYLQHEQMIDNANYVYNFLMGLGWTKNAVCAVLGNMERESTLNAGLHERGGSGFGFVQWTPGSIATDYLSSHGYNVNDTQSNIDGQLALMKDEYENGGQWYVKSNSMGLTYEQFSKSTDTPSNLAMEFMLNYLRPYDQDPNSTQNMQRKQYAERWFVEITGDGVVTGGYQLAQFPMDVINITQGENGGFSHKGTWNIDFVGRTPEYPYYAPCDCECIKTNPDPSQCYAIWKSSSQVMCADGVVRNIVWCCIHESPLSHSVGDKLKKGELMGHTGIGGRVTGDHWHFQVIEGSEYTGWSYVPDAQITGKMLHIYDVFSVGNVEIINGLGYPWKVKQWSDGSGGTNSSGGGGTQDETESNFIKMLLLDTLNGWKW